MLTIVIGNQCLHVIEIEGDTTVSSKKGNSS